MLFRLLRKVSYEDKFKRRINRFYEAMNSDLPIFFLRFEDIDEMQAIKLRTLLMAKFPKANFTLVCLEEYGVNEGSTETDGIFHYSLNPEFSLEARDDGILHPAFTRLFIKLGIFPEPGLIDDVLFGK